MTLARPLEGTALRTPRSAVRTILQSSAVLSGLILAAGCEANHYKLEMSVDGSTLTRKLTCWRQHGSDEDRQLLPMPEPELQRIAAAYGVEVPQTGEHEFEFTGQFDGSTPNDVGGAGALTLQSSTLGRSWAYVERFRGNDDLAASEAERRAALDDLIRLLTGWLHAELGDGEEFEQVRQLLDDTLRHDLENITEYSSIAAVIEEVTGDPQYGFEIGLRIAQYSAERGYFDLKEIPTVMQSLRHVDGPGTLQLARSILAAKLGREELGENWSFLSTDDRVQESINRSLQEHPLYARYRIRAARANPEAAPPPPTELLVSLAFTASGLQWGGFDGLDVTLSCPVEPYRTNGEWSANPAQVVWDRRLEQIGDIPQQSLPALLFAFWSAPDEPFQNARFGRVILQDQALADYCRWHAELSTEQSQQWDALLAALKPGPAASEWVSDFRFAPHDDAAERLAQRGRELILSGLQAE
jgi:hypothetical protein